jgi:hypothetical protein
MDRSVIHKMLYGPQLRFGPYNIFWLTSRSIYYHMALSAMNYLINIIRLYITMPSCYILQCLHVIYYNAIMLYNSHLARSAMNYLIYYTQYMQICQTICFCYCISKTKNEFGQNSEENIILIGPGPYTKILTG